MAWGASVKSVQGSTVTFELLEDQTGEAREMSADVPDSPPDTWLQDTAAQLIVYRAQQSAQASAKQSFLSKIQAGYVQPSQAILDAASVVASPQPKQALPPQQEIAG